MQFESILLAFEDLTDYWIVDLVKRKIYMSDSISKIFGTQKEVCYQEYPYDFLHSDEKNAKALEKLDILVKGKADAQHGVEVWIQNTKGKKRNYCFLVSVKKIFDQGKLIGYLAVCQDISKQKGKEHELLKTTKEKTKILRELMIAHQQLQIEQLRVEQLFQEAKAANKAKTQFLGTITHELKTPINAVQGALSLLNAAISDDQMTKDITDIIEIIDLSCTSLMALIDEILMYSKMTTTVIKLDKKDFYLSELLASVKMIIEPIAKKNNLELIYPDMNKLKIVIKTDQKYLQGIFVNLLGNAIKFTKTGCVELKVIICKNTEREIEFRFEIIDTGIGIEPSLIDSLFTPFTRSDSETVNKIQGTGLGLSNVKNSVELMGGKCSVTSQLGEGSIFIVELTIPKGDPMAIISKTKVLKRESTVQPEASGLKILIVEDNDIHVLLITKVIKRISTEFKQVGCLVESKLVSSVDEAIPLIKNENYDLIITDWRLPEEGDGAKIISAVRGSKKNSTTFVVLNTAEELGIDDKVKLLRSQPNLLVVKPLDDDKIRYILDRFGEYGELLKFEISDSVAWPRGITEAFPEKSKRNDFLRQAISSLISKSLLLKIAMDDKLWPVFESVSHQLVSMAGFLDEKSIIEENKRFKSKLKDGDSLSIQEAAQEIVARIDSILNLVIKR